MNEETKRAAFEHVVSSLNLAESFPNQVFRNDGMDFRFFEADRMFSPSFAEVVNELLAIENATLCCLVNLSRMKAGSPPFIEATAVFFESKTTCAHYDARLRSGGPAAGWLFSMDHYGCASDSGNWIIYCERNNDVAVVALRGPDGARRFSSPLKELKGEAVDALMKQGSAAPFPFDSLVPNSRDGLNRNYRAMQGDRGG